MGAWDNYESRASIHGETRRSAELIKESRRLLKKTRESLSYFNVLVDGVERQVCIIDSDNLN